MDTDGCCARNSESTTPLVSAQLKKTPGTAGGITPADGAENARQMLSHVCCTQPPRRLQISFIGLHWNRGSPFWEDQGAHIEETVWEQIDNGVPWTRTRKYFMLVPVVL